MSTVMIYEIVSTSSNDTERLGELLGQNIKAPGLVELQSDLGGGKTTFARGLGKGFGVMDPLTSPTFSISKIYKSKTQAELHHYDFYRLDEAGVMADQLSESLNNPNVLTIVEWAKLVKNVLPLEHITIQLKPVQTNPDERLIEFHYPESKFALIKKLEMAWQGIKP